MAMCDQDLVVPDDSREIDEALAAGCKTGLLAAHSLAVKKQRLFEQNMGAYNALGQLIVEIETLLAESSLTVARAAREQGRQEQEQEKDKNLGG